MSPPLGLTMPADTSGTIVESMSGRKLTVFLCGVSAVMAVTLVVGAVVSPPVNSSMSFTGTKCVDHKQDVKK